MLFSKFSRPTTPQPIDVPSLSSSPRHSTYFFSSIISRPASPQPIDITSNACSPPLLSPRFSRPSTRPPTRPPSPQLVDSKIKLDPEIAELPTYNGCSSQTQLASLYMHKTDRIRLLQFSPAEIKGIGAVIEKHWPSGIREERPHTLTFEYKLHGSPWAGQGNESLDSRILMRAILAYLYSIGWRLTASTDVSKSVFDKDTMIFRKQEAPTPPSVWLAVSFNQGDRLRLFGAPAELLNALQELLNGMRLWQSGTWKDESREVFEFKIHGYPWRPSGEEAVTTRILIVKLLETLERFGWAFYGSVDQTNGHQDGSSNAGTTDSWYCVKALDWAPGMSVYP